MLCVMWIVRGISSCKTEYTVRLYVQAARLGDREGVPREGDCLA